MSEMIHRVGWQGGTSEGEVGGAWGYVFETSVRGWMIEVEYCELWRRK